ncbi:hypothetical protein SRABI133_01556 [Peribacillus simplex]|uniref:Uncharacterized protein n=1 Tax=Peribacillus simplex TaxID=1478 RepID=A0A9W4KSZ7_9BACI|nr:hypothetical protein SRABI133_01556 [Peribacillus simplex]
MRTHRALFLYKQNKSLFLYRKKTSAAAIIILAILGVILILISITIPP